MQNPIPMAIPQLDTTNLNIDTLLCDAYNGINSITPLALAGQEEAIAGGITWALGKLAAVGLSDTILGCPTSELSPNFLYPNSTEKGGPLNPPPSVVSNTGNDVYGKTYFCTAPTTPQCAHTC